MTIGWADNEGWPHDHVVAAECAVVCPEEHRGTCVNRELQELAFVVDVQARRWPVKVEDFEVATNDLSVGVEVSLVKVLLSNRLLRIDRYDDGSNHGASLASG